MFEGLILNTLGKISTLRCFILESDEVNFEFQNDNYGFCMETKIEGSITGSRRGAQRLL